MSKSFTNYALQLPAHAPRSVLPEDYSVFYCSLNDTYRIIVLSFTVLSKSICFFRKKFSHPLPVGGCWIVISLEDYSGLASSAAPPKSGKGVFRFWACSLFFVMSKSPLMLREAFYSRIIVFFMPHSMKRCESLCFRLVRSLHFLAKKSVTPPLSEAAGSCFSSGIIVFWPPQPHHQKVVRVFSAFGRGALVRRNICP